MSVLRAQLLKMQRTAYLRNLKLINNSLALNRSLNRYAREYQKYVNTYNSVSSKSDLIRRIVGSDIVYHGDYHPLKQSQRSVLRILREIAKKRTIIVFLEMFNGEDQKLIDQFMLNKLTKTVFLKKINYTKTWGYKWENWQPIIEVCQKNKIPIMGINSNPEPGTDSLAYRDHYSAKIIAKEYIRNPEALLYVVDGDYHISPDHLPYQVKKLLQYFDLEIKQTIVYQNAENLYWQLANEGNEDADVLQINHDSYCIMNTTPANKLQSYINWFEYSDDAYYPVHGDWDDSIEELGTTSIPALTNTMCAILGIPFPKQALERLEIYYGADLNFMELLDKSEELKYLLPVIKQKIKNNEGFLLEYGQNSVESYLIYLPTSNLNMAAEESAHFLNAVLRGKPTVPMKPFDFFYYLVITEALGFFGSKLINEKRKAQSRNAIRRYLGSFKYKKPNLEAQRKIHLGRLILQHHYVEACSANSFAFKKKFRSIYRTRNRITVEFATQLGYSLGDKLFSAVKKEKFPLPEVTRLFTRSFNKPDEAFHTYLDISWRITKKKTNPRDRSGSV